MILVRVLAAEYRITYQANASIWLRLPSYNELVRILDQVVEKKQDNVLHILAAALTICTHTPSVRCHSVCSIDQK